MENVADNDNQRRRGVRVRGGGGGRGGRGGGGGRGGQEGGGRGRGGRGGRGQREVRGGRGGQEEGGGRGRGGRGGGGQGGGEGGERRRRMVISNEIRATVVDHVLNHGLSMREAGQRVQPNLSRFTVAAIIEQAGLQYCTVVSVCQNKPFFAAYLCAV